MVQLVQFDLNDLQIVVKNCLRESINEIKDLPSLPELPDKMNLEDALSFLNQNGVPIKKSALYQLTMKKEIPALRFGRRLIFSRKELSEWLNTRLVKDSLLMEMSTNLARQANKKL